MEPAVTADKTDDFYQAHGVGRSLPSATPTVNAATQVQRESPLQSATALPLS